MGRRQMAEKKKACPNAADRLEEMVQAATDT